MSQDVTVYFSADRMLTPSEWKSEITAIGFPVYLDSDFDIRKLKGFLPCKFEGVQSGFEFYFSDTVEFVAREAGLTGPSPVSITLVSHYDTEFACACIACAVLAKMTGGIAVDHQEGANYSGEAAIEWARRIAAQPRRPSIEQLLPGPPPDVYTAKPWWKFW